MPLTITLPVSPESTAYLFGNAFHYQWFREVKIYGADHADDSPESFESSHQPIARHVALGGSIRVLAEDPKHDGKFKWYTVHKADFERAYSLYLAGDKAEKIEPGAYPKDLLDGSADINASDYWLQLAVYGRGVYA